MSIYYSNPALDAELAYRREVLQAPVAAPAPGGGLVPQPPAGPLTAVARGLARPVGGPCHDPGRVALGRRADGRPGRGTGPAAGARRPRGRRAARRRSCWPATPGSARPGCSTSSRRGRPSAGVRVLIGHCVDLGDVGLPYLPFVDLLRPVAADPELAPAAAGNPVLAGLLAGPDRPRRCRGTTATSGVPLPNRAAPQPVDDGRLQLFESVAALLCELAAAGPLLVVLEDVHWADRSSRDLLRYLLARLVDEPVVVVASYRVRRPAPPSSAAAAARRAGAASRRRAAGARAPAGRRGRGAGPRARRAGGLPEEHRGRRRRPGRGQRVLRRGAARRRAGAARRCRSALTDVLLARVEQRSRDAQQVLRVAAVAGRRVRHELVAAVGGLAPGELEQALAETVHHHLLVVSDDGRYRFRHALLREAVLADLLPGERVRLHGAIAAYLAATPGAGTAAERAHHARESNDLPGALSASLEAAEEACRLGAPAEQLQHLEAALALWSAVPDAARGPAAIRPRCCWTPPPRHGRRGSCTAPWRCCARRSRCSARTPTRLGGPGCTPRWPRRCSASRTWPARSARARPPWRWCRPSRRRRCAPGPRPRPPGSSTPSAGWRRATPPRRRRSPPPTSSAWTAPGPTPPSRRPGRAATATRWARGGGWRRRWSGPAGSGDGDVEMRVLYNRATQSPSRPGRIDGDARPGPGRPPPGRASSAWSGRSTRRSCGTCR